MFLRFVVFLLLLPFTQHTVAQQNLSVSGIPENLKENANAIVRLSQTDVVISSIKSITIKKIRIVTVLNELGLAKMNAVEYYDNSTRIKDIGALIYNADGKEIKKIKKKDFQDQSVSGGSVITDNRVVYLDYTPVQYPFTMIYSSETESSNTAFIPTWSPVEGLYASTEKSIISITYPKELGFRYKEYNFSDGNLIKEENDSRLLLSTGNIAAMKKEDYLPSYQKVYPHVLFGLTKFQLEGVEGEVTDWASFGAWYNTLLAGTDELPDETVTKIKNLTAHETDPLEKAKIVYAYVQGKTRYISIQLGIGGWKPMKAKDVDRLGYGDCKALSNYTRALLKAIGIPSYCVLLYGDTDKRNLREDFVSMQGNHMILVLPVNGKNIWLECTSQKAPFGFQGDFTDDRLALVVKPGKGELTRTHIYKTDENTQACTGNYSMNENGRITGNLVFTSKGTQYDNKYMYESRPADELMKIYRTRFNTINNIKLTKTNLRNNKDSQEFTEDIAFEAEGYGNKNGTRIIFAVNAFNQLSHVPQRYRNRASAFEIERGWKDTDEIVIELPQGYGIEAKPDNIAFNDKFGEYSAEYVVDGPNRIIYKRSIQLNNGFFESGEYENYRAFREKIARNDNAKIVLVKK